MCNKMEDPQAIMLSEVSQRRINIVCYHLHVELKKQQQQMNTPKQKLTHRYREQTSYQ